MIIKFVRFARPVVFHHAPGGTDYWSPAAYPKSSVTKRDGGILITCDGREERVLVGMGNVDQVTYVEVDKADKAAPAKAAP